MKRMKYIFGCVIGLVFIIISCENYLEETPLTQISSDFIYSSPEGLEYGVNALHGLMRDYNVPNRQGSDVRDNLFFYVAHDLGLVRTWMNPYDPVSHAPGIMNGKWVDGYQLIDRSSAIITAATELEQTDEVKFAVSQAKVIRAEIYFDLFRMFKNILLDTIPTTPENFEDSVVYKPADSVDIFRLIDSDLDYAIQNLDYDEPYGRYGQGAARHLRGKSAMWQGKWTEAVAQFDSIIEDGHHRLVDIKDVFAQNLNHAEDLFAYTRNEELGGNDATAGGDAHYYSAIFNCRFYEMKHKELVQSVEYGGQSLGWAYPNDYLKSLYDQDNDKRFTTYYYPTKYYVNNPDMPDSLLGKEVSYYSTNYRRYHFSLKKFHDLDKAPKSKESYKDIMYYRFAETLLLGAEAHWRASDKNPTNPKALEYINMIRERAYGNSDHNFTEFTLDSYLEESARELALEKVRWFLLKRLGLLVERQNMHYRKGGDTNAVNVPMAPHMVNLPIPQSQIDLMGTFPQNPGY